MRIINILSLLSLPIATVLAFQSTTTTTQQQKQSSCHVRHRVGPLGPVMNSDEPSPLSYSERTRSFRRDYYTHESWIKHRSKERFIATIIKIFDSIVVRALRDELIIVGGVAVVVVLYNALLVTGWEDFSVVHHEPLFQSFPLMSLPLTGFTLSSSALSVLLGTCCLWDEVIRFDVLLCTSYNILSSLSIIVQCLEQMLRIKGGTKREKHGVRW